MVQVPSSDSPVAPAAVVVAVAAWPVTASRPGASPWR